MKINLIMVTTTEYGERVETPWEAISPAQQAAIAKDVTDRFFGAIGLKRVEDE